MNKAERMAKVEEYGAGYKLFRAALGGIPQEAWEFVPAPGEWSIHEILVHMADSESLGALRVRKMIAEPGSTVMEYEEAKWAQALDYRNQNTDEALEIFRLARQSTYHLLKTLPDEIFEHTVIHPQFDEPYTFEQWFHSYTVHVPGHVEQMNNNLLAWKERNK